jgi:hypothetical protein
MNSIVHRNGKPRLKLISSVSTKFLKAKIPGRLECEIHTSFGTKLCECVFENPASNLSFVLPIYVPKSGIRT